MENKTRRQENEIVCMFTMVQQDFPHQSQGPLLPTEGSGHTTHTRHLRQFFISLTMTSPSAYIINK